MECPKCKAEVSRQAPFCWRCGATLAAQSAGGAAAIPAPARRSGGRWLGALVLLLLLALAALLLLLLGRSRGAWVGAGVAPGNRTPMPAVTAETPGNFAQGGPVTAMPATPPQPAPGLPGGQPRPARPAEPFRADIAEYLRKLEAIQRRDEQNPIAALMALMAFGMGQLQGGLALGDDLDESASGGQQYSQNAKGRIEGVLREKRALAVSFQAITPVPEPCLDLHALYGRYLTTNVAAIQRIAAAVTRGDIGGAMSGLGPGKTAERAAQAAAAEESRIRARYRIPRTFQSIVP
ncbi:MAG: hypothetical protein HY321_08305 [Armatimonadetes bacterium]|nr:hypothetical protein [Armatimonadota bacterium]